MVRSENFVKNLTTFSHTGIAPSQPVQTNPQVSLANCDQLAFYMSGSIGLSSRYEPRLRT